MEEDADKNSCFQRGDPSLACSTRTQMDTEKRPAVCVQAVVVVKMRVLVFLMFFLKGHEKEDHKKE